jgi:ACS family hexuronate transporter-like MFS transporter
VKVVSEWFPPQERAMACGVFNSGSSVGAILAPPIVAYILLTLGWRAAFVGVGLCGFVWLLFWWPIYRTPTGAEAVPIESRPTMPVLQLIRVRFVWAFLLAKIFMDPVWYFYIFWFPEYLKTARHFNMASIGKYAWIPFAVAGLGNFAGGAVSSLLLRRGASITNARKVAVTFFAVLMMSAIPAVLVNSVWVSIGFVALAMAGYTGCLANMLAMPADVFPQNAVASVFGLASMGSGFGGMVFTLITGWVVDHHSYTPVFIGFGIVPLICALVMWMLLGPLTPISPEDLPPSPSLPTAVHA